MTGSSLAGRAFHAFYCCYQSCFYLLMLTVEDFVIFEACAAVHFTPAHAARLRTHGASLLANNIDVPR